MIRFLYPQVFWALALLPLLAFWWGKQGRSASILFSSTAIAREAGSLKRSAAGWIGMFLRLLAVALLIAALARPQLGKTTADVEASGIDIILAVDCSGSMQTPDYNLGGRAASRIEVVKAVVSRFIDDRPNDRIGVVAFAAYPYLVCPLTLDHDWLQLRLQGLQIGQMQDGTAIGSGIASAVNRLREQNSKSRIVILLTDGINNCGKISPLAAAEAAEAMKIKVYTIGAGSQNGESGSSQLDLDEDMLRKIAEKTGAKYYRAADTDSMRRIYAEINQLETTRRAVRKFENYQELFHLALFPALLLLGVELGLSEGLMRRLP
ncbi:MAG: VWA domain-containing protein [Methylacidiphilales bacterium]|nr:VWA domain-containing protein [Candidatus Methylacidiphilales bacterium]